MILVHFQKTFRHRVAEWLLALVLFSWGLILLRSEQTFDGPAYIGLVRIADEWTWAWWCVGVGGIRLAALAINGLWRPSYHFRSAMAFLSCFFWLQISLGFMASGTASTALAVYPWFLLADLYSAYRAAADWQIARAGERAGARL